ncbi:MAG: flagellar motor protein MotB [Lentimonas sp.]
MRSKVEESEVSAVEEPAGDWRESLKNINTLELPKIQIDLLQVQHGTVNFRDESNAEVYSQMITPINLTLHEFTTAVKNEDVIRFSAETEQGTALKFEATLTKKPMTLSGLIELSGFDLSRLAPYYKQYTQFELARAVFGMRFDYRIDFSDLDHLLVLSEGRLELSDILCRPLSGEDRVIALNTARLDGIRFEFPQLNLQVDKVTLQDGETRVARSADGSINLLRLVASAEAPEAEEGPAHRPSANEPTDDASALTYHFDSIEILDYQVAWADALTSGEANVTIDIPRAEIKGASSDLSAPLTVSADYGFGETGSAHIEGSVIPEGAQVDLDLTVTTFPLTLLANYAQEFGQLTLKSGTVSFDGKLQSLPANRLQVTGAVNITDFAMTTETPNDLQAGWQALDITGIDVMTNPIAVKIEQITLNTPHSQLRLPVGTSDVEAHPTETTDTAATSESAPLDLLISNINIQSGSFTLIDESVQPAGEFKIEQTELSLINVSLNSPHPTQLDLKTKVNQSQLTIKGQLYPADPKQDSTLKIDMTGLALPTFSSYTGKAVGRKIDNGIFALDANWTVKDSQLKASNKILIDQMRFGDKVDSDTAMRLPLDLAITLLKGVNGEMDLSLPLSGDLSDPKASVWQIVRTATVGLITNVAAAPFKLLSNLVGSEADLSHVVFAPNSSQLNAGSIERLNIIAKALKARPQISLSLTPTLSNEDDTALAKAALHDTLLADSKDTDDVTYRKHVTKAYKAKQKAGGAEPATDAIEPDFAQMETSLLVATEVPADVRKQLAQARAAAVEDYLISSSEIEKSRLTAQDLDADKESASVQFELK